MKVVNNQGRSTNERTTSNKSFISSNSLNSVVMATLLMGAPSMPAIAGQNSYNDSFIKTEIGDSDEGTPSYSKKQSPDKALKKFKFNYNKVFTMAKESGIDLKHTIPDYPGYYESLNKLSYLDKDEQMSLKDVFKRYDDNENNALDTEEIGNFIKDAEKALEISPTAYPLTSSIMLARGKKIPKTENFTVESRHHSGADYKLKLQKKEPKIENVVEYVSYPKTERDGLRTTQKYVKREDFAEVRKAVQKYEKLSLKSFNFEENLKAELKKTKEELKNAKTIKDTVMAEFKQNLVSNMLELRPGESVTYVINQVGDDEYLDSKQRIFKYTISKQHFNRIDVKQGEYKAKD